ncbi:MAG: biotin synthase BioB [Desulfobacteraceae bacterium]|nr:biotin synthase BioB [Desulfobacteraceae bacterium]MBC2754747.1 biotin synthase BioB [Desulfobacteraceae bacterium]
MLNKSIFSITEKIFNNKAYSVSEQEALILANLSGDAIIDFLACANRITSAFLPKEIFTCTIINAKSGHCSQDCAFCAQSAHHQTDIRTYPLLSKAKMVANALEMEKTGATYFSMVTSGERLTDAEIETICSATAEIKSRTSLTVCGSLGMLTRRQAQSLKQSGMTNYHHNLETAESFFDRICTTHTYAEDIETLKAATSSGLLACSGCILGIGESWAQRVELAFTLKELNVKRIPINFLNPIPGTRLEHQPPLSPMDALKSIALFRFINPKTDITICGGREHTLKEYQSWIFMAGANGVMIGNYLTTRGRDMQMDLEMIDTWQHLRE